MYTRAAARSALGALIAPPPLIYPIVLLGRLQASVSDADRKH